MLETALLIVVCLMNIGLGVFVLLNNTRALINRIFAGFTLALAGWSAVSFFEDAPLSHAAIGILAQLDFILAGIAIGLFFWFCANFTHANTKVIGRILFGLVGANALLTLSHQMVTLEFMPHRVKFVSGPGYPVFIILAVVGIIGGLYLLASRYRRTSLRERLQLRYIYLGLSLMFAIVILTNVILPAVMNVTPLITRSGIYGILLFTALSAYAMIRHRLFDIRLVVARAVAFTLVIIALITLQGLAILALSLLFFRGTALTAAEVGSFIAVAVILAFSSQPLRRFFERVTDRIFFRDRYDSQDVLNDISSTLAQELYLEPILNRTLEQICQPLRIAGATIVVFEGNSIYQRTHVRTNIASHLGVIELKTLDKDILVADEMSGDQYKTLMEDNGIRVSLLLKTKEELVGLVLLGDKLSGEIYSYQDLKFLEILRKQLAVAIVNAKAYEEISRFNTTLQEQIQKATERLRTANKNLKVLDKTKDEFLSMASHQLGTPLTAIMGYLSMALDDDKNNMTPDQKQYIQYGLEASERMGAMTHDLLNVSRLSAGKFVIRREPIDLVAVVRDQIQQLAAAAERKQLKVTYVGAATLPPVTLDISKTTQVIMNLIDNAIYYTEKGSITINLEREHDAVAFTVTDTGMGVPPAEKPKLFAKFYRAENAKSARPDGTGLGLYLAKRVIEEQGGSIIFDSQVGKGSTFGFLLPINPSKLPKN